MTVTDLLTCPLCGTRLAHSGNTLVCTHTHSFDIAREGYVNLLRKKMSGDTKEMLMARRQFLERGHYQPLSDTVNELVYTHLRSEVEAREGNILDAGCGEGYYLGRLQGYLAQREPPVAGQYIGIDLSKEAVKLAAKRYRQASFVVANLKERLALGDGALDVLLNIFAPRNAVEYARVLAPGGLLLIVIPGPQHLLQLREALHLLNMEEQKQQHVEAQFGEMFTLLTSRQVSYTLHLQPEDTVQAVMMTPNYWHLSTEMKQGLAERHEIQTAVDFHCLLWRRKG